MRGEDSDAVRRAKAILAGQAIPPAEALQLVKQLKKEDAFRWGRRILEGVKGVRFSTEAQDHPGTGALHLQGSRPAGA